jgi:hypothetical protein
MNRDFLYRFLSSRWAVSIAVVSFLVLTAAVLFRIIPWWLYLLLLLIGVLGILGYAIVSELMALRQDQKFKEAMREQGESRISKEKAKDRNQLKEMHDRWLEGFELLQKTIGKRSGKRAVYFLPWYVIIGKPATGKTTAISNAGLQFPMGKPRLSGTGGTRNCDWFFSEEAVLLDTAGRYTTSGESETDKEEWISFLKLLAKYRRDVPINGLLVAVSAEDLLDREREDILTDAREMRGRLDELMTELGIQFPVYLLVTKCDLIQGFADSFGKLDKKRLTELLGWTSPSFEVEDVERTLDQAFSQLNDRCKRLRPTFMRDDNDPATQRNIYLFPEELEQTTKALAQYCDVLFRASKYSDSPFLRGIYFTSGFQTGTTVSHMLKRIGLGAGSAAAKASSRSFFLQDFFQSRLKTDQRLVKPTGVATTRFRVFNNLGLGLVALTCVLAALLFGTSYVGNRRLLLKVQDSVDLTQNIGSKPPAEQLVVLDNYRKAIEQLREHNEHPGMLERFGLYTGAKLDAPTTARFMNVFDTVAYKPALDSALAGIQHGEDPTRGFAALDAIIAHLVATRNARSSSIETGGESLAYWLPGVKPEDDATRDAFARNYRFFLREPYRFGADPAVQTQADQRRAQVVEVAREKLPQLLTVSAVEQWLKKGQSIRIQDVKGLQGAGDVSVQPAYTPKDWQERVAPLLAALDQVQDELGSDAGNRFARDYAAAYFRAWYDFSMGLRAGSSMMLYCDAQGSPYFAAFELVNASTTAPFLVPAPAGAKPAAPVDGSPAASPPKYLPGFEPPAWVQGVGQLAGQKKPYADKIAASCQLGGGSDPCTAALALAGGGGLDAGPLQQLKTWMTDSLVNVSGASDATDRQLREHMLAVLETPVVQTQSGSVGRCADKLKQGMEAAKGGLKPRPPWPLDQLEATLSPQQGSVWQYCQQDLAPFFNCASLSQKPNVPVKVPGDVVSFLQYADKVKRMFFNASGGWREHTIQFQSVPTTSGSGTVDETTLSVACSNTPEQPWQFSHRQIRATKVLSWDPSHCAEAKITVNVDGRVVEVERKGPFGLLELLAAAKRSGSDYRWDFRDGDVTVEFVANLPDPSVLEYFR